MKILLAVSGGVDSMYLANRAPEIFPGARFAVAHCNFSLRGEESDSDEAFVREWCREHDMECFVRKFDTTAYAAEKHISMEMAARDLRYAWFAQLCREGGFDALATAHNANDNAETLILNLLRGTGSRGLRGIAVGSVLRPLIDTPRTEIESWMKAGGHAWREDRTNSESIVKRNMVRNEVFPVFGRINPSYIRTLNADMKRFAQVDDIAEDYLQSVREGVVDAQGIKVDALLGLKHWKYVLYRLTESCGFSQETFDKLTALLEKYKERPRGTVTLGGKTFEAPDHTLKAFKGHLIITERVK